MLYIKIIYIKLFKMYIFYAGVHQQHLLMDNVLRCHGNIPAEDNEEIMLRLPSAFQTTK